MQGKDLEDNHGEWTGNVEIKTRKKFLAVGEACMAIFQPTPSFKRRTFVSSGFSIDETLIAASAVPYHGNENRGECTLLSWIREP